MTESTIDPNDTPAAGTARIFSGLVQRLSEQPQIANTMLLAFCYLLVTQLAQTHQSGMMRSHITLVWKMLRKSVAASAPEDGVLSELDDLEKLMGSTLMPMLSHPPLNELSARELPPLLSVHRRLYEELLTVTLLVTHEDMQALLSAVVAGSLPSREKLLNVYKDHTRHLMPETITRAEQDEYERWLGHLADVAVKTHQNEH